MNEVGKYYFLNSPPFQPHLQQLIAFTDSEQELGKGHLSYFLWLSLRQQTENED